MCGIAGVVSLGDSAVRRELIVRMGDAMAHRGPDGSGIFHTPAAALLHLRLAIIDLSPAGHEPMCNEDETLWLTYNGEVYNYRELIPTLTRRGHRFRSECDAEVVLHAYEEYGESCVEHFNGMFAFAIWDVRRQTLFCARDRCGVKPLYYAEAGGYFAFASEIKALLALPWVPRRVDERAVHDYLLHGYVDHTNATFFAGIVALPPAHTLRVQATGQAPQRYWSMPSTESSVLLERPSAQRTARLTDEFRALLEDSVRLRLRSDVPVGTCLSGGLDSSTIVCLMNSLLFPPGQASGQLDSAFNERWHRKGELQKTFSACYDDPAVDERRYIDIVLRGIGAEAHQTFPRGEDLFVTIGEVVWHQDEPFLSTSIVAQWQVMKLARSQGVTVLLDGQGADELLCGYPGYFGPFFADLLASGRLSDLTREMWQFDRNYGRRWGSGKTLLARTLRARHEWLRPQLRSRLDPHRRLPPWLVPRLADLPDGTSRPAPRGFTPGVEGYLSSTAQWLFEHGSLPALLRYEDRNSMAFGLESRVPFLDYRLVEFAFRLPTALRLGDGLSKRILRRATRGVIPEEVRRRRDKIGFNTPEASWFRGPARQQIERLFAAPSISFKNYVHPEVAQQTVGAFMNGAPVDSGLIWRWINLDLWLRSFIDRAPMGVSSIT